MLNYRRYGGSEGRPTEARNAADAVSAYDCLRGQGVAPSDIVAYGESLGTAVATRLSLQREVQALVLEAPFTSTVDVGKLMWKGFPLGIIMVDQYRTIDRIGDVTVPLFIVHGGRDSIIPLDQARRVYHAANEPKSLVVVPQAGHNDLLRSRRLRDGTRLSREPASGQGGQGRAARSRSLRPRAARTADCDPNRSKLSCPALGRASTISFDAKRWMAGTSPAMTEVF